MKPYKNREEKAKWIVEHFRSIFNDIKSILDVGCDQRYLCKHLPERIKYIGIDICGAPDIYFNIENNEKLPFNDNSFDLVLCADVLEHLENIHATFDELCRVSKKYILISLPNPFSEIFPALIGRRYSDTMEKRKEFGKYIKFYGLPLEKPLDRHKWFFSTEEAIEFVTYVAEKNNFTIKEILFLIDFQSKWNKFLKFLFSGFNRKRMLNLFNGGIWIVGQK